MTSWRRKTIVTLKQSLPVQFFLTGERPGRGRHLSLPTRRQLSPGWRLNLERLRGGVYVCRNVMASTKDLYKIRVIKCQQAGTRGPRSHGTW